MSDPTPRVLIAGLYHETNTFLPGTTSLSDFTETLGAAILGSAGGGSPMGGAVDAARALGWSVVPAIDLRALPSARVDSVVAERFRSVFEETWTAQGAAGFDGVLLVLHGAMVTQDEPDVEGALLAWLRALPGAERTPVAVVLDLHANTTEAMARHADVHVAYRTNPHIDGREAAEVAARALDLLIRSGRRAATVRAAPAVLWPPAGTGTDDEPMRTLEAMARAAEADDPELIAVNVLAGFSYADIDDAGVSFTASTVGDPERARRVVERLSRHAWEHRAEGLRREPTPADIAALLRAATGARGPLVVAEPSDNIGGGTPGDTTALLAAFLELNLANAAVAIADPVAVATLGKFAIGAPVSITVGGRSGCLGATTPFPIDGILESRSDGRFLLEDPTGHLASMGGGVVEMGPCAVVRTAGVRVLLTSRKTPPFDLGMWRSNGIVPESLAVVGVKAAVAHRRAWERIAEGFVNVDTPGPSPTNLLRLPWKRVRRPIFPLDP
ncbi:MAG: M81 family metallopeptidase [Armatimonadota bacterium]